MPHSNSQHHQTNKLYNKQTMSSTIPSNSLNNLPVQVYSRRLLLHTPLYGPGTNPSTPVPSPVLSDPGTPELSTPPPSAFDANVVMILAVLLCALICALGLNSIVRCALRCSTGIGFEPEPGQAVRLATGVRRKAIRAIPVMVFSPELKLLGSGTECSICLSDLVPGERIRVLPKCSHGFHVRCIDRWLMARPSCPTCRQCLFTTAQKGSACRETNGADAGMDAGTVHSIVVPLEPEGYVHSYRGVSRD